MAPALTSRENYIKMNKNSNHIGINVLELSSGLIQNKIREKISNLFMTLYLLSAHLLHNE